MRLRFHVNRSPWAACAALVAVLAVASTMSATPVRLILAVSGDSAVVEPVPLIALRVTDAGRVAEDHVDIGDCHAPGDCTIDLPPGIWLLTTRERSHHYVAPRSVIVPAAGEASMELPALPTTEVTGSLGMPVSADAAVMRFHRAGAAADTGDDSVPCEVSKSRWSCLLPQGTWDLRFSVRGYAPHYLYDFKVPAKAKDAGLLQLSKGASLSGRVVAVDTGADVAAGVRTIVTLTAVVAVQSGTTPPSERSVFANDNGTFHLLGVAPGAYRVQARRGVLRSEARPVEILADREALLREPLALAQPLALTVRVRETDPRDEAWTVDLKRLSTDGTAERWQERQPVRQGAAVFTIEPGSYEMSVRDAAGSTWNRRRVEVGSSPLESVVDIRRQTLEGLVRLGEQGIPARLELQDNENLSQFDVTAGEDGSFTVEVPETSSDATWRVVIDSPLFDLKRTIEDAHLQSSDDGKARLDITFPRTRLSGRVVEADGSPLAAESHGFVNVSAADGTESLIQPKFDADGEFVLNGLPPGRYTVRALLFGRSSDLTDVTIAADSEDETRVVLRVKREREVSGLLTSDAGPVVGAIVVAVPTDQQVDFYEPATTGADGRLVFRLPNGSVECDFLVEAPGFAMRLFHRQVGGDSVTIRVEQRGGELRLHLPPWQGDPAQPHPWLIHDGAAFSAYAINRATAFRTDAPGADGTILVARHLEPGAYTLCLGTSPEVAAFRAGARPAGRCTAGQLPPFGSLELDGGPLAAKRP